MQNKLSNLTHYSKYVIILLLKFSNPSQTNYVQSPTTPVHQPPDPFRLNVGFLINQHVGYSRDFPIEIPYYHLPPDLDLYDISGSAKITRTAQGLLVLVKIHAALPADCVRCLINFSQPLNIEFTELYAFSKKAVADAEFVLPEDGRINLGWLVREYMLLDIPISSLCTPDCKGLCPICGENQNETTCDHDNEAIDPRLAALKSLIDKK